ALRQTGDAEDRAAAKALAADIAIRRLDDALKDSGKNASSAKGGFAGLAGEITGFGAAAGVADSKGSLFTKAMAGLSLASGVLEPALAGVVVAAGGLAAGFAAAGAGLGVFGAVAKSVFAEASKAATAYAAAQAKYASATTSKQRTAALAAEKAAFAGLSPPVKTLATELGSTQKMWKAFTDAAAPGVVGVISKGLGLLPKILASMKPFLAPVETALRGIIGQLNTGLSSAGFTSFIGAMAKNTGPAITKIATAIGNVVVGIGGILKAFLPTSQTMLSGIDKITKKFREWGTTLSSHSGFQSLMATFRTETPQAVAILKNLGTVLVNVGKAMFGLSTFSNSRTLLAALLPLSGILASLSQNQGLTRIVLYLVAATTAARKLGPAFLGIKAAVAFFPAAAAAVTAFAGAAEGATVAETIAAAATRAWGLAMDALPWVALAAAVVAVAVLVIKYHTQIWHFMIRVWNDILHIISGVWHWIAANWPLLLGILTGPVGIAALEIIRHWHDIQHALGVTLAAISTAWNTVWGALRTAFRIFIVNGVLGPLGWIIDGAAKAFGWIPGLGGKLKGAAKAFDQFKANVNASLGGINGRTVNVSVAMTSSTNPYPGGISGRKASGGKITGPGGPRADTAGVFALSDGEWVIQSQSAARYGPAAMSAVNEGKAVIGYAAGGPVGVNVNPQTPSAKSIDATLMGSVTKLATAFAKTFLGSGPAIVAYARQFLGQIPYVFGGNSLSGGIDCSGFTQQIYSHFGIGAPRTSEAQFGWVRRTGPVPGGLAFFVSPGGGPPPGHVAIVQDGNSVISQGGGMGPRIMGLHDMPLMGTGIPPSGFGSAGGSGGNGPAMPAASGSLQAIAMSLLKQYGWGNQWNSFNSLEMAEAGWNMTAQNPHSSAYGLAQFINGPSEYFQYGGNPSTGLGQLTAMMNYIGQRWHDPNGAWANEAAHHWYANGTPSAAPGWAVVGERGPELVRMRGGEQVIPG
ncbi:MAG TPA: NlpC/P60 family protein, partial [Streptosporangiaceae bacterium]|nr:NlpC/P60 family protein [Streptosporangiaceae bacterium]